MLISDSAALLVHVAIKGYWRNFEIFHVGFFSRLSDLY